MQKKSKKYQKNAFLVLTFLFFRDIMNTVKFIFLNGGKCI